MGNNSCTQKSQEGIWTQRKLCEHHNAMEHIELKAGKWTVLVNAKALSNIARDAPLFKALSECILVDLGLHLIEAGCAP